MTQQEDREHFNATVAPALAGKVGVSTRWSGEGWAGRVSTRFAYFADADRFVVVAGAQEAREVDLALAYGNSMRGKRRLVLVLPEDQCFATVQRVPWLLKETQPDVYAHGDGEVRQESLPSPDDTVLHLAKARGAGVSPEDDMRASATAHYLGDQSDVVAELVEWATKRASLDAGHRKGERSWHRLGQKVLSIARTRDGLRITAGIHYSKPAERQKSFLVPTGDALEESVLDRIKTLVREGEKLREESERFHKPDEHWLQAVLRKDPYLLGIEQPALRELPAFRPGGTSTTWGRGFIDLIGLDGHGHVRIVETKLASNADDLFALQGLDYLLWSGAYQKELRTRLGASAAAPFEVHYVVGEIPGEPLHVRRYTTDLVRSLDPSLVRWRFQLVRNWFSTGSQPEVELLPVGALPETEPEAAS